MSFENVKFINSLLNDNNSKTQKHLFVLPIIFELFLLLFIEMKIVFKLCLIIAKEKISFISEVV